MTVETTRTSEVSKLKKLPYLIALTALGIGTCSSVWAQSEDELFGADSAAPAIEELFIIGYRSSLMKSLSVKKESYNISDAIYAEDIGKTTDQNIAEALQRITGVSIDRTDGEGSTVVVRGIGGSLNKVILNGVPLTGSGDGQNVNFSEFSADILQSIIVQKTPSASTDEGGLGAIIYLDSARPLDAQENRRVVEYQARQNDFADTDLGDDRKYQFAFTQKLFDDRLGISLVAADETTTSRLDRMNVSRWVPTNPILWATYLGDTEPTEQDGSIRAVTPLNVQYMYQTVERDRTSIQFGAEFEFWPDNNTFFTYTTTDQDIYRDNQYLSINGDRSAVDANNTIIDRDTNTIVTNIDTAFNRDTELPFYTGNRLPGNNTYTRAGTWRNFREITADNQKSDVIGLNMEQLIGDFTINIKAGHSSTTQDDDFNMRAYYRPIFTNNTSSPLDKETGSFAGYTSDNVGGDLLIRAVATEGYYDDGKNFEFQTFQSVGRFSEDESTNLYFDVEWDREFGPITSLESGFKYALRDKKRDDFWSQCGGGCVNNALSTFTLNDFSAEHTPSDWGDQLGLPRDHLTDGWVGIDLFAVRDFVNEQDSAGSIDIDFEPSSVSEVEEKLSSIYLQANFEMLDAQLYGDIGLRYANTKVSGSGPSSIFHYQNSNFFSAGPNQNLSLFGFEIENGTPLPSNTATRAEAEQALVDSIGPFVNGSTSNFRIEEEHSYSNLLPSLNINYSLQEDMILRFAASQTIARPELSRLYPSFDIRENIWGANSRGTVGSVELAPYKSTNVDLSFEWYFEDGSLFSAAIFNKDLSGFASDTQYNSYWKDVRADYYDLSQLSPSDLRLIAPALAAEDVTAPAPNAGDVLIPLSAGDNAPGCMINREFDLVSPDNPNTCDVVTIVESVNGAGGYVRGLELGVQHVFSNLPGLLSGFGVTANYTYSDSRTDGQVDRDADGNITFQLPEAPLAGTSEHTLNSTIFWEKNGKLIRLAYNQRSDYLANLTVADFGSHWVEGYSSLDLSANWDVTDNVTLSFQAVNLTDTVIRRYDVRRTDEGEAIPGESHSLGSQPTGRTTQLQNTGTIYRLGLRLSF